MNRIQENELINVLLSVLDVWIAMIFSRDIINIHKCKWNGCFDDFCACSRNPQKLWPPIFSPPQIFTTLYRKLNCLFWDLFYLLANRWFNIINFVRTFINRSNIDSFKVVTLSSGQRQQDVFVCIIFLVEEKVYQQVPPWCVLEGKNRKHFY